MQNSGQKSSLKQQMTEMILSFEKRKSQNFTFLEFCDFKDIAVQTFKKAQRVSEIKNNSFSMYYCSLREESNNKNQNPIKYLEEGIKMKNPFCAFKLIDDYIQNNFSYNFDIKKIKECCKIAETIDNGFIYLIIKNNLNKWLYDNCAVVGTQVQVQVQVALRELNNDVIHALTYRAVEEDDSKYQTELAQYYYNYDNLTEMQYFVNLAINRREPNLECVEWLLENNIADLMNNRLNCLQIIAYSSSYDRRYYFELINLYKKHNMNMNIIPLLFDVDGTTKDNKFLHKEIDNKMVCGIIMEHYKNKLSVGINCIKDLSNINEHTNFALAKYYCENGNYYDAIEFIEPMIDVSIMQKMGHISPFLDDDREFKIRDTKNVVKRIPNEIKKLYMVRAYKLAFKISFKESLSKYICKDIVDIILLYN
jgi:hypothetical protein